MFSYANSLSAGKRLLFLLVLFSLSCYFNSAIAQDNQPSLKIIYLNQDNGLIAQPSITYLIPGDSLQFVAVNGVFDIMIFDAINFLQLSDSPDLSIPLDSGDDAESDIYVVTFVNEEYREDNFVYCRSQNRFPTAPPRIIVQSNTNDE